MTLMAAVFILITPLFLTHSIAESSLAAQSPTPTTTPALAISAEPNIPAATSTTPGKPNNAPTTPAPAPAAVSAAPFVASAEAALPGTPATLSIPAISLKATIQGVGVDSTGAMAVPTVKNTVGWYENGTIPGNVGSAVLDAHVYLAFKNLNKLKVGGDVYVIDKNGTKFHFRVISMQLYPYTAVPLQTLFNANDAAHLNMITCAGTWLPAKATYSERLVVYTTLVN